MSDPSILPDHWEVPEDFHARMGAQAGRQRAMTSQGHLLLILHAVPDPNDVHRTARFFWRNPAANWDSSDLGQGQDALEKHLDQYEQQLTELDQSEQSARSADMYFAVMEKLTPVRHAVGNLHEVLQEARKSCPDYRELIDLRDRAYTLKRTAELLFSTSKNALDLIVARQAEQQSKASHRMSIAAYRLNILAAFFFPIITLTALLGLDVNRLARALGFELELGESSGMETVLLAAILVCGLATGWVVMKTINRPVPK